MGYAWVDTIFALGVALFVFYLALSLFKRSVPVLVDHCVLVLTDEELTLWEWCFLSPQSLKY
ncbi:MAG TPA: hypothetical protein VE735_07385 [Gammaproteobacteria bacterium]|jgi:divalent metal cation (Fe/Co/Zn/Cd) transporter|nr:hypothetical protein [Gammaproteobacteria bacterium]